MSDEFERPLHAERERNRNMLRDSGWWYGISHGELGWFRENFPMPSGGTVDVFGLTMESAAKLQRNPDIPPDSLGLF